MAVKKQTIGSSAKTIPKRKTTTAPKKTLTPAGKKKAPGTPPVGLKPKPIAGVPAKPPAAPPRPDFGAWYKSDPRYLNQNPQFQAARSQTYAQYGWFPVLDAAGKPVLNAQGQPTYRQASAQEAPGSITNQFAQALAGQSQNVQDSANSRGLLFSGAQVQGQQNAIAANDTRLSEAQLAFQRALSGVNTDESNLVNSLYTDYLATAPPAGAAKPAAAAPKPVVVAPKKPAVPKPPSIPAPKKQPTKKKIQPVFKGPKAPASRSPIRRII
jgi:hypothetical protein